MTASGSRFSRKSLNIIIVVTSIMIIMFLKLPGQNSDIKLPGIDQKETADTHPTDNQTALSNAEKKSLFGDTEALLESEQMIAKTTPPNTQVAIQAWRTTEGAKVLFVESNEIPMIDIRVIFNAGSARDGKSPGLALFTNAMLNEGAGRYDVTDIAAKFESLGAQFSNESHRDMATVSLRSLTDQHYLNDALNMFSIVISKPNFPEKNIDRIRKQLLISLQRKAQSPGDLASDAFFEALYPNQPYGSPSSGTPTSLKDISQKSLKAFHQRYYVASNMTIAIVGAVSASQAKDIGALLSQALPKGEAAPALSAQAPPSENQALINVEFPSSQSHIFMGMQSITRNDPRRTALMLGNNILGGGGFTSRLNKIIRQDNGLAYSIYSYFSPMAAPGPFIIGLQTRNAERNKALTLINKTLTQFIADGPTEKELKDAKQNIVNSFPLNVASNSSIVGYLGAIGFYDLPLDYLDTYLDKVNKISINDIKQAFSEVIIPSKITTVVAGPTSQKANNGKP